MSSSPTCRFCNKQLKYTFVDLGMSPLCESFLAADQINQMEPFFPLHVYVCENCFLVQLEEYVSPENIFTEYAYFSSFSDHWLKHARVYVDMATARFSLNEKSHVVELASNDGYLLQYFVQKGVPATGIEPAANVARSAEEKGVRTIVEFFGENLARRLAAKGKEADLLLGNNVLAQVPDINDFIKGMKILLKPGGIITMEFPHLIPLMEGNQFDTIYHEHFSYFSFFTVNRIFTAHGVKLFDVEELGTHGGSIRIYGCHAEDASRDISERVQAMKAREQEYGIADLKAYDSFREKVLETKRKLLELLIAIKRAGKTIAGYGAPGKGNTLLNYCGIRNDFLDYTVDRNPYKHGKFLPGTHIPIFSPEKIVETKPDYLFILPWNLKNEIINQNAYIREWGGRFIVPIPEASIIN